MDNIADNIIEKYNLFLIEDNPAEVRLMTEAIKDSGLSDIIRLNIAYDGEEAISYLSNYQADEEPRLILLDLNLPKISGKEVLRYIKGDDKLKRLTTFIVTNSDNQNDIKDCQHLDADGYFQKPTEYNKLVQFFLSLGKSIRENEPFTVQYLVKHYQHSQAVTS
ncbi:MAG: response regulator [Bacteroidia bacterium]|nr:response regulator [Bacteroidia bacterium]